MFNAIRNAYAYWYFDFVKQLYTNLVKSDDDEEVYDKGGKVVVLVKNEEIGKRLKNIIIFLADNKEKISTKTITLKVEKYYIDTNDAIKFFLISYSKENIANTRLERLKEFVEFVESMHSKNYVLDETIFNSEKCSSISNLLSFFIPQEQSQELKKASTGCVIKHIHHVCSGKDDFNEFYKKVVDESICSTSIFPYVLPVIKMCYNYYARGEVPDDIYDILQKETFEENFTNPNKFHEYSLTDKEALKSKLKVLEENEEYNLYEGNIKIYNNISAEFAKFIQTQVNPKRNFCLEKIKSIIIDFNGETIGYKFSLYDIGKCKKATVSEDITQVEIVDLILTINNEINGVFNSNHSKEVNESYQCSDFNLEDAIVYNHITYKFCETGLINIKELFKFVSTPEEVLRKQELDLFFKLYLGYLSNKYGKLTNKKQFLSKEEVKYINPGVAEDLIKYALGKPIDYYLASESLNDYLKNCDLGLNKFHYDKRFNQFFHHYYSIHDEIIFDFEVEAQYGITIQNAMEKKLSDDRKIVIFEGEWQYDQAALMENERRVELKSLTGLDINCINFVAIEKVICTTKMDSKDMYTVKGYVTTPVKGHRLTDKYLLTLNNKELLKIMSKIFSKLNRCFIPGKYFYVDGDDFYVDIMSRDFQVKRRPPYYRMSYLEELSARLISKGYNKNAFEGINLKTGEGIIYYELFNAYCKEHDIYYDGSKRMCPVCLKTKYFVESNYKEKLEKIFEDSYAEHYSLTNQYNLKVYKPLAVNMSELEKNVLNMVVDEAEVYKTYQDCFLPCKKALDKSGKFIGYIYKVEKFEGLKNVTVKRATKVIPGVLKVEDIGVCENIMNSENLPNLPKIMSLIRLIIQVENAINNRYVFMLNPFGDVFLNRTHKKQVQVLNIDFLRKKTIIDNGKNTKKWTCDYVRQVISSDSTIEIKLPDTADLDSILEILQKESKELTKYCSIHKIYYKNKYKFCPKCASEMQMEDVKIKEISKDKIIGHDSENEGGEAFIYPYSNNVVAKVFKLEKINYELKIIVLSRVLKKKHILEEINSKKYKYKYIIPKELLLDASTDRIFGYTMDRVFGEPISILRDKVQIKKLGFTRKDVLEILITIGQGIETLHANNIYIGDLNGRNILFDSNKNVYFLDFDGMGVDNIAPEFCTDGYIDPNSKKTQNITMKDDWYSFAIQAFYYLTFTHPFNGIYTTNVSGNRVALDIPDKMERGISLLGNHGMKIPAIAEPWDWMDSKLKNVLLEIFEGHSRVSIVPYLIEQYNILYNGVKPHEDTIRINSKFIAKKITPFGENVEKIINHYSAICKGKNEYNVKLLIQGGNQIQEKINFPSCTEICNILLSDDEKIVFAVYKNEIVAIDINTNARIYAINTNKIANPKCVVVNGNTLYYTEVSNEGSITNKCEISSGGALNKTRIKFLPKQQTKYFCVQSNSKFVFVKAGSDTIDEVYCNSEKLCNISHQNPEVEYNIIYDSFTKTWLVINSEGNGIIIKTANGTYKRISKKNINDVSGINYCKGILYIPTNDILYIINLNNVKNAETKKVDDTDGIIVLDDQATIKKLECKSIITPSSKLYNINTEGFSVITNNTLYEIRRG